jgi:hypothetical protein
VAQSQQEVIAMRTSHKHMLLGGLAMMTGTLMVLVQAAPSAPTTATSRTVTASDVAGPVQHTLKSQQDHHTFVYSGEAGSANAAEQRMIRVGSVGCGAGGSTNAVEHCAFPSGH